jgi:hypothetical protein
MNIVNKILLNSSLLWMMKILNREKRGLKYG